MDKKPVVLIVEDDQFYQDFFASIIGDNAEVLSASTIDAAEKFFLNHIEGRKTISIVAMDGCVDNKEDIDTLPLIKTMREERFKGPIVAISRNPYFREMMRSAGCDHETTVKLEIPDIILKLIAEMQK